jgi:catalase
VGNNLPVFFIRDAIQFPDMVHAFKPSPDTNLQDPRRVFDFFANVPEGTHMLTRVYSDAGIPASYLQMDGSSVHAYKLVDADGNAVYAKFRWHSLQGVRNLTTAAAARVQASDFNHATRDLVQAINAGQFPRWDLYVQLLTPDRLDAFDFDPLDPTKVWTDVPEVKVGTMTLNRNPANVFQETEQAAFAPGNLIPGIEPSEDRLLQGRLFAYSDTQFHRVGTNVHQVPINAPKVNVASHNQDGAMNIGQSTGRVNYEPSVLAPKTTDPTHKSSRRPLSGTTQQARIGKTLNFRQAGEFYRSLPANERNSLVANLAGDLGQVTDDATRYTMLSYFYKADADYGARLARVLNADVARVQRLAESLTE